VVDKIANMKYKKYQDLDWQDRFTYKKNVLFTADDFNVKRVKFQIVCFAPKTSIKDHWHQKTTELFFIKSGRGLAIMNGKEIRLEPGDTLLCEPKDHHAFINDGDEDLILLDFKVNEIDDDIYWPETGE